MMRACSRIITHLHQPKQVLTPSNLTSLINHLHYVPHDNIYSGIFLLAFHCFFRISSLLPKSNCHLTRGDMSISSTGLHVFFKWSKTMQASRDTRLIPLAAVPGSPLCPLQAIIYPAPQHCPMFSYLHRGKLVVISQAQARLVLSNSPMALGLNARNYWRSWHSASVSLYNTLRPTAPGVPMSSGPILTNHFIPRSSPIPFQATWPP